MAVTGAVGMMTDGVEAGVIIGDAVVMTDGAVTADPGATESGA